LEEGKREAELGYLCLSWAYFGKVFDSKRKVEE
jgi:hypothetical protein